MLMAGSAVNIASILVVKKSLGNRFTWIYLLTIVGLVHHQGAFRAETKVPACSRIPMIMAFITLICGKSHIRTRHRKKKSGYC